MRPVDHSAADRQNAGIGLCIERLHYSTGVLDLLGGWGEGRIDHADLSRMDGKLAGEALAGRGLRLFEQSFFVAEVGEHAVNRLHSGCSGAGETE